MKPTEESLTVFVAGSTGATGRLLTEILLDQGHYVRTVVRSISRIPEHIRDHSRLSMTTGSLLEIPKQELVEQLEGCRAIASCLGHNLTLKGIYGKPRRLVTDAARNLCEAALVNAPTRPVKYVLMNTTGNRDRNLMEPIPFSQRLIVGLLRHLLPPQADNEQAADYLRTTYGGNDQLVEWSVVRPDGLIDLPEVTEYSLHQSPVRNVIFNAGKTSRINVAHFMSSLITDESLWQTWKSRMPVIYNSDSL